METASDGYAQFLAAKAISDPMTGLVDVPPMPACMFPFQADITRWALRRGRAALFAGTGLGKSLMELAWAQAVHQATGKDILHLAPLVAVSAQLGREADKFGIEARVVAKQSDCTPGTNITNYQKLDHFDLSRFGGVILDESSILKSIDGHYRTRLIKTCQSIPFRLAATATPAPNDFMELGNHAEFLGVMSYTDMLATFFTHDGGDTQKWRIKGHAENEFWKWMASWAVMLRKPSDLGYSNEGYDLPPLQFVQHMVSVDYAPNAETGMLFPMQAETLQERIAARRATVADRCELAASITPADRQFVWWCHLNAEADLLAQVDPRRGQSAWFDERRSQGRDHRRLHRRARPRAGDQAVDLRMGPQLPVLRRLRVRRTQRQLRAVLPSGAPVLAVRANQAGSRAHHRLGNRGRDRHQYPPQGG
jgi:hypothetical protein